MRRKSNEFQLLNFKDLRLTLAGVSLFIASAAQATLTMSPSQTLFTPFSATTNTIYIGATTNSNTCSGVFCNSCATAAVNFTSTSPFPACSLYEIHSTDLLTLNVTTSSTSVQLNASGNIFYYGNNSTWTTVAASSVSSTNQGTVSIPMSAICAADTTSADASCQHSFTLTLYVGVGLANPPTETGTVQISYRYVDVSASTAVGTLTAANFGCSGGNITTDYEGVCKIGVFPGDSKTYVNSVQTDASNTSLVVPELDTGTVLPVSSDRSGMTYTGLAIYAVASAGSASMTTASDLGTLKIVSNGAGKAAATPNFVDGLTNGTLYQIGFASVDQAGILTFFSKDPSLTVEPEPVYGLLNGQGCFIATAAYGSSMAPEVNTFREFRGKFLMSSKMGRWFSRTYYKFSPVLAEFISQSEGFKFAARLLLWPLLVFVQLSLNFGLFTAFASLVLLAIFTFLGRRLWIARSQRSTSGRLA